jgi:excisionase family DNA binding protein
LADYLKIPEVARRLDVSEPTVRRMVKGGKLPSVFIGGAYRVSEEDLEKYLEAAKVRPGDGSPKDQARPPLEEHQLSGVPGALENYMRRRAKEHDKEVRDSESPFFRNATTAALWVESVSKEIRMWVEWVLDHAESLQPPAEGLLDMHAWDNAFKLIGHRLSFNRVTSRAEKRIAAMTEKPDELALKRMEHAQAEAQESFRRLDELRRSASG